MFTDSRDQEEILIFLIINYFTFANCKLSIEIGGSKVWTCVKGVRVFFNSFYALPLTHPFLLAIKCGQEKERLLSDTTVLFQKGKGNGNVFSHI